MDYRELEYAQLVSRICETFIKLEGRDPISFQLFQKHISRIKPVLGTIEARDGNT